MSRKLSSGHAVRSRLIGSFTLLILLTVLIATLVPEVFSEYYRPFSDGECEQCHSGFEPYVAQVDSPREVPEDHEFDFGLLVQNPWAHELRHLKLQVDLSQSPGLSSPSAEVLEDYSDTVTESVSAGYEGHGSLEIRGEVKEVRFELDWQEPLLYAGTMEMVVTGPRGTEWSLNDNDMIVLSSTDVENEGYGIWDYTISNTGLIRGTTYTLSISVDYTGRMVIVEKQIDRIEPGESETISVRLDSLEKGSNSVSYHFEATAYNDHESDSPNSDVYSTQGEASVEVGDELVYERPEEKTTVSTSLWVMGRILGFFSVALFIISFLTGGTIKKLNPFLNRLVKKRVQWHCVISYAVVIAVIAHFVVLYLGYYSHTYKGLISGGIPLLLMVVIAVTGIKKSLVIRKFGPQFWRRTHLWISLVALILLLVHGVIEGTDLAFLRWW